MREIEGKGESLCLSEGEKVSESKKECVRETESDREKVSERKKECVCEREGE